MKKITIPVSGMHCRSCELILEKSIKKLENIEKVEANEKKWTLEISYNESEPDIKHIEQIVKENGYKIGSGKKLPWISTNIDDYINLFVTAVILFLLYIFASSIGWNFWNIGNTSSPTASVALLIGLTAGVSSCMALIGGLVLGITSNWNKEHANASTWTRFSPHIFFHIGRVVGFSVLGGVLGFFWSAIHFSNMFLGAMTGLVGLFMLTLGFNLTNLSPRIWSLSPTLPKFFWKNINGDGTSIWSILITGALTFFLPCGFTLAMQVYAISTGSALTGALILGFFALGTIPGLISIGLVTALLRGEWLKKFLAFTWVIVLILGIYNISNGYTLISLSFPTASISQNVDTGNLEVQEVRMTQDDSGYTPNSISIDAGKKIRWIITSKSAFSCSSQITVPSLGISKQLKEGENIIEFVAPISGEIPFSCSMGMYRWKFIVTGSKTSESGDIAYAADAIQNTPRKSGGCGMMNGNGGWCGNSWGGCGMMRWNTSPRQNATPSNPVAGAKQINMTYTTAGLSPNEITLKKWQSYTITIDVKDTISGCMHMILIPGMDENAQALDAWNKITFNVTPKESGRFLFTCAMGVPHGYITIE